MYADDRFLKDGGPLILSPKGIPRVFLGCSLAYLLCVLITIDPGKTSFVAPLDLIESHGAFKLYVAKVDPSLASNQSGVAPLTETPITLTFVAHDLIHEHKSTVGLTVPDRNQFCLDK